MIQVTTAHYKRISKAAARRIYDNGGELYFCPVKLNPESPWGLLYWPGDRGTSFDDHVNVFEAFNCNAETGRYTAFYVLAKECVKP